VGLLPPLELEPLLVVETMVVRGRIRQTLFRYWNSETSHSRFRSKQRRRAPRDQEAEGEKRLRLSRETKKSKVESGRRCNISSMRPRSLDSPPEIQNIAARKLTAGFRFC